MATRNRKDAQVTQRLMHKGRLRSPSACQRLLSGSGQETLGACFVQERALSGGRWNVWACSRKNVAVENLLIESWCQLLQRDSASPFSIWPWRYSPQPRKPLRGGRDDRSRGAGHSLMVRPTRYFRPNAFGFGSKGDSCTNGPALVGVLGRRLEEDQSVAGSKR